MPKLHGATQFQTRRKELYRALRHMTAATLSSRDLPNQLGADQMGLQVAYQSGRILQIQRVR